MLTALHNPDCMKLVCSLIIALGCSFGVSAQKCEDFLLLRQGKLLSITNYNREGKPNGRVVHQVLEANLKNGHARIHSVVFDLKGNVISDGISFVQCTGALYRVDIHLFLSLLSIKQLRSFNASDDQFVDYPLVLNPGEVLPDARYALHAVNSEGLVTDLEVSVDSRMVIGEESVETPLGLRNCYKIKSHITCRTQVGGITIPLNVDNTEWFSPEIGIVKNEAKSYRSALTSID